MKSEPADSFYGKLTTKERKEHEHVLYCGADAHYEALLNQLFTDIDEKVDDDVVLENFKKFKAKRPKVDVCFAARQLGLAATCEVLLENLRVLQYEIDSLEWRKQAFKEATFLSPQEVNFYRVFDKRAILHEAHAARSSLVVRWLAKQEKDYLRTEMELNVSELCRACKDFSLAMPNRAIARAEFELRGRRSLDQSSKQYSWMSDVKLEDQYKIFESAITCIEQSVPRYRFFASLPPHERAPNWWLPKDTVTAQDTLTPDTLEPDRETENLHPFPEEPKIEKATWRKWEEHHELLDTIFDAGQKGISVSALTEKLQKSKPFCNKPSQLVRDLRSPHASEVRRFIARRIRDLRKEHSKDRYYLY